MGETKCGSCRYNDWSTEPVHCRECIGFHRWKPATEPKKPPKPIYLGHRDD